MITELDKDGNASLSFDEFLELMAGKEGRDEKGTMNATLSHQKVVPSFAFGKEDLKETGRPIEKQASASPARR